MDEGIDYLESMLRAANTRAARAALSTLCAVLSGYATDNAARADAVNERVFSSCCLRALPILTTASASPRWRSSAGCISATILPARQTPRLPRALWQMLTLLGERRDGMLAFFNRLAVSTTSTALLRNAETGGGFTFEPLKPVAFFPRHV